MAGKEPFDFLGKLIIVGDSGVGKTNLVLSFVGEPPHSSYLPTIGVDFKSKTLTIDSQRVKLQIWDTAGQERYRTITETYYKGASAIVLAYSITDRSSFDSLHNWATQIAHKASEGVPMLIVGNKKDLEASSRVVGEEEGRAVAMRYSQGGKVLFRQVSAIGGEGVQEAFEELARLLPMEVKKVDKMGLSLIVKDINPSFLPIKYCEC